MPRYLQVVNIESSAENSPVGAGGCAGSADVVTAGDAPATTAENQQTQDKGGWCKFQFKKKYCMLYSPEKNNTHQIIIVT